MTRSTAARRVSVWSASAAITLLITFVGVSACASGAVAPRVVESSVDDHGPEFLDGWIDLYLEEIGHSQWISPPVVSRELTLLSVALYEGLVGGMPGFRSVGGQLEALPALPTPATNLEYDWLVAASVSVEVVFHHLWATDYHAYLHLDAVTARLEEFVDQARALGASESTIERSLAHGRELGEAIVEWSRTDGHDTVRSEPFVAPEGPGAWVRTGVALRPPMEPKWGRLRPAVPAVVETCGAPPPVPYAVDASSEFFAQALATYEASRDPTSEERAIVTHWADEPSRSFSVPGHWQLIARSVAADQDLGLDDAVELYLRVALAVSDAAIVCWATKYETFVLRPETFIRRHIDPEFRPIVATPPFPAYTSGHAVMSNAAAATLEAIVGPVAITDRSGVVFDRPVRRYASASAAAEEAAASRVLGGIHYPMDDHAGVAQGECVGAAHRELIVTREP